MPRRTWTLPSALAVLMALAACSHHDRGPIWSRADVSTLSAGQQIQLGRAVAARNAMFSALLEELGGSLQERGAAASLAVCKQRAPRIAAQVADEHDLRIGRTSRRLRNPANTAPAWALLPVDGAPIEQHLAASSDGDLGVLQPILVAETCLQCHGADDQLAPGVREALAADYPRDDATGFAEGDLRGWFWVEVPPVSE